MFPDIIKLLLIIMTITYIFQFHYTGNIEIFAFSFSLDMLIACCLAEIIPHLAVFMTLVCGTVAIYAMDVEGRAQHQHEKEHIKPNEHAMEFSSRRQLVSRSAKYSVIDEEDEDSHDNIGVDDIEFEEEEDGQNDAEGSIDTSTVDIEG